MTKKIGSFVQAAKDIVDKAQEKVGDLHQLGADALKHVAEDINELLPNIARAGYHVEGIDVDMAIPPKIAVHCRLETQIADADREVLLASLEGRRIASTAIRMLFQVADLQKNLSVGSLRPSDVILELGVSPAVRVQYREPKTIAAN